MPEPYKSTTQLFLDLYDIAEDFLILGDGTVSLVLNVSALNFGLLSESEQDATIYAYAALLNSLSFPIQIVIRSQPKDVTNYIKLVERQEQTSTNPIYRQKIREYRLFVESLVSEQNILDKKFYIVIPLTSVESGIATPSVIPGVKGKQLSAYDKNYILEKAKTNLYPRRDHLIDQLARIGLYSRQLNTQELIGMLYSSYNPESYEGQKVTDTSHYTSPLVEAQLQGDFTMSSPTDNTTNIPGAMPQPGAAPAAPNTPATGPGVGPAVTPNPNEPAMPTTPAPGAAPSAPPSAMPESPTVNPPQTPGVQTPSATPAAPMAGNTGGDDPQASINQTISQMGMGGASTPSPSMPSSSPAVPPATPVGADTGSDASTANPAAPAGGMVSGDNNS